MVSFPLIGSVSLLISGAAALPAVELQERSYPHCRNDTLLQLLSDSRYQAEATPFCSTFIGARASTVTNTVTVNPTALVAQPTTVIIATTYVTVSNPVHETSTATSTTYVTDVVSATITVGTSTDVFLATDFTTETTTTSFATETSSVSLTITDATTTSTETDHTTATVTAAKKKRSKCNSTPGWLESASAFGASKLSSACSCLATPATITTVVTETGTALTSTTQQTVDETAQRTETAAPQTDVESTIVTGTDTSTATIDTTATTSITSTVTLTLEATAVATTTAVTTQTIGVTDFTIVTATVTDTTTVPAPQPTSGACNALPNPYTASDGKRYEMHCGSFFPITAGGLVGTGNYALFSDCVTSCGAVSSCVGVDYDQASGLCDLFSTHAAGELGFFSALLISP